MNPTTLTGPKGRLELGMVLIALGLFLTLGQARVLDLDGLGRFWPLFLIGIGLVKFRQPIEDGQRAVGAALLFAGGFFQVMTVLSWWRAWPLALVFVGGLLMWQAAARPGAPPPPAPSSPFISELALMGGSKRSLHIPDFQGGYITAVMGGVELDLRKCKLSGSAAVLDVVAFWGGIDLKVPADWRVEGQVLPLMGGFEDKTQALVASDQAPRLVLRGYAIMGGVAIGH
jgi:LiaF transmembrane domain